MEGPRLYAQRLGALVVKRAACARRDRLAVVTQLAVPIALVLTALWTGKAYINAPNEPPLIVSMCPPPPPPPGPPGGYLAVCDHVL